MATPDIPGPEGPRSQQVGKGETGPPGLRGTPGPTGDSRHTVVSLHDDPDRHGAGWDLGTLISPQKPRLFVKRPLFHKLTSIVSLRRVYAIYIFSFVML
jgi:hypothetical protein